MSHASVGELLVNAFSEDVLVDAEQDSSLPPIPEDDFIELLTGPLLDHRASLLSQKPRILNELKGRYFIPPKLFNYCFFIDLLFEFIEYKSDLDIRIFEALQITKPLFIKLLIKDPRFVQTSQHYLRQWMDEHFGYFIGWESSLGELGQTMLSIWKQSVSNLNSLKGTEDTLPQDITVNFSEFYRFVENIKKNEEKCLEKEHLRRKNQQKEREIDTFLDAKMELKKLPPSIAQFLTREWRACLLAFHKRETSIDYDWDKLTEFTVDMIETFSVNSTRSMLAFIPEMKPNLETFLTLSEKDRLRILTLVDDLNAKILNNEDIDGEFSEPLLEENRTKKLNMSSSVIEITQKLKRGQWLYFQDDRQKLKIAGIYENPNDFLFVNALGNKVKTMHQRLLAYQLISKKAKLITSKSHFNKCFVLTLEKHLMVYSAKSKESSARKKQLALEEEKQRLKALEKAKIEENIIKNQKEIAESKLRKEAEQLRKQQIDMKSKAIAELEQLHAEYTRKIQLEKERDKAEFETKLSQEVESLNKVKSETEQASQRELIALLEEKEKLEQELREKSDENRRYKIVDQVKRLSIGSWLSLPKLDDTLVEAKIAIIYPSTGKYAFVDKNGLRVRELTEQEIIDLMLDGKAYVLKQESSFDSSMQEMIKSLRK